MISPRVHHTEEAIKKGLHLYDNVLLLFNEIEQSQNLFLSHEYRFLHQVFFIMVSRRYARLLLTTFDIIYFTSVEIMRTGSIAVKNSAMETCQLLDK